MIFQVLLIQIMVVIFIKDLFLAISFTLCNCAISWKATHKSVAVLSITKVEPIAATEGVKEVKFEVWLMNLV